MARYIFITGGVVSSLGKGLASAALGALLQARGYSINQFALASIPYLVIIAVLVLLGKKRAAEAPEGLKKVFEISPS